MQYIELDHAESCGGQTEDEESNRYLSLARVQEPAPDVYVQQEVEWLLYQSVSLSVWQFVSGHIFEHLEQITNACSFFLQCIIK